MSHKHSEETRRKISETLKRRYVEGMINARGMKDKKHSEETKQKISDSQKGRECFWKGKKLTDEHRKNISESCKGYVFTEEHKKNLSKVLKGRKLMKEHIKKTSDALRGRKQSKEHVEKRAAKVRGKKYGPPTKDKRNRISESLKKWNETHDAPMKGKTLSEEQRKGISNFMSDRTGSDAHNWQGGKTFEPYCSKFNFALKEKIRNRDNRVCQFCGKSEIINGERLSVHHIDGDKMQGCNGKGWYLVSLCRSCNVKKDNLEKEFLIVSRNV